MSTKWSFERSLIFKLFLLFVFCLVNCPLKADCCYALLVADTFSPTGAVALSELEETSLALEKLCQASGVSYKETLLLGDGGSSSLLSALDSLNPTSEDLVFFVFLGHGYRLEESHCPWPIFCFFHTHESLAMQSLLSRLRTLPCRLLCVLADCCNYPLKRGSTFNHLPSSHIKNSSKFLRSGKGCFIISAAEAGSSAYCTDRRHCCAAALWKVLHEESCRLKPSWNEVGVRMLQLLAPLQTPYYTLDIFSEEGFASNTLYNAHSLRLFL